jgi:hypothetical protein
MAFRSTVRTTGSTGAAALASVFAAGSARSAAVFAIATGARSAFRPGRAEFIHAEVSVAVDIQLGEGCDRVGNFYWVDDAVAVGVEGGDDGGHWASVTFGPGRRVGVRVGCGEAQGGGSGGQEEGLVDEFHRCVCLLFCFFSGSGSALVSTSINTRCVKR